MQNQSHLQLPHAVKCMRQFLVRCCVGCVCVPGLPTIPRRLWNRCMCASVCADCGWLFCQVLCQHSQPVGVCWANLLHGPTQTRQPGAAHSRLHPQVRLAAGVNGGWSNGSCCPCCSAQLDGLSCTWGFRRAAAERDVPTGQMQRPCRSCMAVQPGQGCHEELMVVIWCRHSVLCHAVQHAAAAEHVSRHW